ncbi:MAG TPA: ATP-binding protein [Actinocrinis sp.]|nr:ATP-binding protein [Actinocrinis sp.]
MNATPGTGAATTPVLAPPGLARGAQEQEYEHADAFPLPAHKTSVATARHRVDQNLAEWGVPESLREDAALIISELFTNALIHTDSVEITCRVLAAQRGLYVSITDQGHGPTGPRVRPVPADCDEDFDDAENGRGLLLVSTLAATWGVATDPEHGRTVWAVLNPDRDSYSDA